MSDSLRKLIEDKEKQQQQVNQTQEVFKDSIIKLYSDVREWLSEFPSISINEVLDPKIYNRYEPGKLSIKIVNSLIELSPDTQRTSKCIGSVYMQSQKGRKRLCLKELNVWHFDDKKELKFNTSPIQNAMENIYPTDTPRSIVLNKDNFTKAVEQLI